MDSRKGIPEMKLSELDEFLELMGWSRTMLAAKLGHTSHAIDKWYRLGAIPTGPVSILLQNWLFNAQHGKPLNSWEEPQTHSRRNGKHAIAS